VEIGTFMGIILKPGIIAITLGLLLLCSCSTITPTTPVVIESSITPATQLPADVDFNSDAGRGGLLHVIIQTKDGEKLPFIVDTGSPVTILDKSLEPKLGSSLDSGVFWNFGAKGSINIYAAPKLYLGGVPLMTGSNVCTLDLKSMHSKNNPNWMGILGMDCMKHYCIQLDFEARKMRFLDPNHLSVEKLGKGYPLIFSTEGQSTTDVYCPYIADCIFFGEEVTNLGIDVGCNMDGGMDPRLFRQEIRKQRAQVEKARFNSGKSNYATFPEFVWGGETYTNVTFRTWPRRVKWSNLIGLSFLARHLVTLDFPGRMMYLNQRSIGPLVDKANDDALKYIMSLKEKGQAPGWTKDEHGTVNGEFEDSNPDAFDCVAQKIGDPTLYHYRVARASGDSPWKLQRAWRTDAKGNVISEYRVE
jgi:hypothetical protein